ncbi:MAG: LURP-one-related/scramblase family protein [Haloglomus sp.]
MSERPPESTERDVIGGIDLSNDEYVVTQAWIRSRYKVEDSAGNVVLRGKKKRFRMKEDFPFTTPDGDVAFRVKAQNIMDVAGDYNLVDEASGEAFAVIEKEFTLFQHVYRIRSPDGELWATIESESTTVMALKSFVSVLSLIPHSYTITDGSGTEIGTIEERFSLRDQYDVRLGDTGDVPREAIMAAAVAIDALEEN